MPWKLFLVFGFCLIAVQLCEQLGEVQMRKGEGETQERNYTEITQGWASLDAPTGLLNLPLTSLGTSLAERSK